jgi:para-nitrobenzyl esterase
MASGLRALALASGLAMLTSAALAQTPPPTPPPAPPKAPGLALAVFPAKSPKPLTVTSPAFANGGDIPFENTAYRGNIFPGLKWTRGPYGTRSFVIIMQDADVNFRGGPLLHWSMYDVPVSLTQLAAGMTTPPPGASFGPNVRGLHNPYMGPHTPPGPKHHYHFAVLALDEALAADPALTYDALAAELAGHVLASGELVGLGQADPTAPPRPPPAPPSPAPVPACGANTNAAGAPNPHPPC